MKKIIILSILLFSLSAVKCQDFGYNKTFMSYNPPKKWAQPELLLPSITLVGGVGFNEFYGSYASKTERDIIGFSTIAISVAIHFVFKSIRKKRERKVENERMFIAQY